MRILVTGASGFVGGSFMSQFAERSEHELMGIGRRPINRSNYKRIDLSEPFSLSFKPDVVVHCAALASPWGSKVNFQKNNVDATQNVLDFCRKSGLPRLIYISSSSVFYRNEHQYNMTEETPIGPIFINEYARTKYLGERLVRTYEGSSVILRPRAVFGPGDTVIFPRILRAAKLRRLPLLVSDGPPAQADLIYIESLCDYIMAAALKPILAPAYNLTNNRPVIIQDFLLGILTRLNIPLPTRRVNVSTGFKLAGFLEALYTVLRLPGEPALTRFGVSVFAYSKTFDVNLAIRDFGEPSVDLDEGVNRFIAWQIRQT